MLPTLQVRKSVSKAELKSRLYDKGISIQTMPSVKRPIPENVKPYAAKLTSLNKPPIYNYKAPQYSQTPYDDQNGLGTEGGTFRGSQSQLGFVPVQPSKHMKSMSSDPYLKTIDKFQKSQQRDISPSELYGGGSQQETIEPPGMRPQTSTDAATGMRGGQSSMGKSISNPQFTTLNMAPYSRPQTQAFGFRNSTIQQDPSRKVARASEEVTSITGLKTMTPLGPSAMNRPKTSNQDLLKKRSQSNKALKRRIIGGKSEAEEKRKQLIDRINEEDQQRKIQTFNNSPHRKANDKVIGGAGESTDELLRQHFLMAKIRKQNDFTLIQRPSTTDGIFIDNVKMPQLSGQGDSQRMYSASLHIRGPVKPPQPNSNQKYGSAYGKSPFNARSQIHDQIEEHDQEDENQDELMSPMQGGNKNNNQQQQQLDQTKSDHVITHYGKTSGGNNKQMTSGGNKWNDLDKLITLLQNQPDDDGYFIYLKPSEDNDPYDLQPLIEAEQQNKNSLAGGAISKKSSSAQKTEKFFTLSKKGITTYISDEPVEYISLTDWLIERNFFQQISDKKFFKQFRRWKIIRMWRRNILQKKREEVKNNLQEKLFILDGVFGEILLKHRAQCKDMEDLRIIDLSQPAHEVFTQAEFAQKQDKCRDDVVNKITDTSEKCRVMFKGGIKDVLEELRQKINDQNEDEETHKKEYMRGGQDDAGGKEKKTLNSDPVFEQLGFKHNLKYGPRSKLRRACSRFLRFSYLLDFVALDALSSIYVNSVHDTISKLARLANIRVDYELRSKISQFGGEQQKKPTTSPNDLPLFFINGVFEEIEIPQENYVYDKVDKYDPIPIGNSTEEDFDPTIHLVLQEIQEEVEEIDDQVDEALTKVDRVKVRRLNRLWLNINPLKSDFLNCINETFQDGLECLKHFERWSRHEELLPYVKVLESWDDKVCDEWDPPDDNNLNCDDWLQENPLFQNQAALVSEQLGNAFNKVYEFFEQLEPYLLQYWENNKLGNFAIIEDERLKNPTDVIPLMIKRFEEQKRTFENFIPEKDLGMIRLNFKDIKKQLTPSPIGCYETLKKMLPKMVRRRIDEYKQWLLKSIESINTSPTNVESYVKQIQSLEYIDANDQMIKDKIELNVQIYHIIIAADIEGKEEKNKRFVDEIYTIMNQLNQAKMTANESSDKRKDAMKATISAKIPRLKAKVEKFTETILQEKYLDVNSNMYETLKEMEEFEITCAKLVEKSKKISEFQKTLQFDVLSNFDYVEEARIAMLFRGKMWRALVEWSELIEKWKGAFFEQIEVSEISQKADIYTKIVVQCQRSLPPHSTAAAHLKKLVFDFRETMPIVEALGNKNLQKEHWDDIKAILNTDFPLELMQFKLSQLIKFKVADFQEDIINVATTATQEFKLGEDLKLLEKTWDEQELKTVNHKEKSEVFKLTQLDVIQALLDESLTTISNIIGSRYVKRLQVKADLMSERLNLIFETLEEWKECQRSWLYLDNIFASQDIRKQNTKEFNDFDSINKLWQKLMKAVSQKSKIQTYCQTRTKYNDFVKWNGTMDKIQKALEEYLEVKRQEFPRFYFLSNDELLQILANASYIREVIKHINKCFDNINSIIIGEGGGQYPELVAMVSSEQEEVKFSKILKLKLAGVEIVMRSIEEYMMTTVAKMIKDAYSGYQTMNRKDWVLQYCGQAIAVVGQITWTESTEMAINDMDADPLALSEHLKLNKDQLLQLTELIRGNLDDVKRKVLVALITTDIHDRDIIETLCQTQVESTNDFNWQKQLRYSLDETTERVIVKQVNAIIDYGYEYMGATSRLVVTPLTDRCWITITGAMNINLGAAPAGPAGTGKTESTKDLAKALGIYCVVFNCSDQIEYKMMARLFSGLAQSGAWACLDEFNRIDVEVLSVIAQQLLDIKEAKSQKKDRFIFNAKEMPLKMGCGVFVTMNPGYAGRTELPDNLKVLFRPVSMMIPAYGLIAEIMLQAEGFAEAKTLSTKMVQLYKLASEQLSQQDHYDFGMRAVKSVLVMAGKMKRDNPKLQENVVLIRAMRDSNVPKFLADDLPLFSALIQDLFPGVDIPEADFGELSIQIEQSINQMGFQKVDKFITKSIQLFDTFNVRFGVMIVGPTGAGKTTCYKILADAMEKLRTVKKVEDPRFQEVRIKVLNPKSITMGELYGEENEITKEWTDGLASKIIRKFGKDDTKRLNWCVFDGPVDALWIENMNTVLDDNMTLCLANGERIKLKWTMRMLFEVQDLSVASPATVSRCGMVYMTPSELGWRPYLKSWLNSFMRANKDFIPEEAVTYLEDQFEFYVDMGFEKIQPIKDDEALKTVQVQVVTNICNYLEYFIKTKNAIPQDDKKECERKLKFYFGQSFIWAIGCSYKQSGMKYLDNMLRDFFQTKLNIPAAETVFEYFYSLTEGKFISWEKIVPAFEYDSKIPFFQLLVPTVDTIRYTSILEILVSVNKPVFLTGNTGVGKSIIVQNYIQANQDKQGLAPLMLNFSAQTNSLNIQQTIEAKLTKRGKKFLCAKGNQTCVIFVDDVNMPMVEQYGAQPPIELLRQIIDTNGSFYDRPNFFKKTIEKFIVLCAAAPPGGGRSALTPRFMRHFHILCIPDPSEYSMKHIFENIIEQFLAFNYFSDQVKKCGRIAVAATNELYTRITKGLLPIPAKFHYTFNLRDVAKVFQGMLMTKPTSIASDEVFAKLWIHECSRVFYDRLINEEDRDFFREQVIDLIKSKFQKKNLENKEEIFFGKTQVIFSMLLRLDSEDKLYEEILDKTKLFKTLEDRLTDYNLEVKNKMDLVFFDDAINHICRISRILRQPRGNAMLIGVSGCGKQSLTRLSSFMLEYDCFQIKLSKNYKAKNFQQDLKGIMLDSGCKAKPNTFLMTDTQIMNETFLEDLNNILNTGEITNLYEPEDKTKMNDELAKIMQQQKRIVNPDYVYQFFIERLRDNFHIILCMSPVGDQLRIRCRKFPSLVNCCTLDWFDNWPEEALLNVSERFITQLDGIDSKVRNNLSAMFMKVHKSVETMSDQFYEELRRKVYITPKSYLDGINLFIQQLLEKRKQFAFEIGRLSNGILKLQTTNDQIAGLQITLTNLQPKLEIENKNAQLQAQKIKESKVTASQKEIDTEHEAAQVFRESQTIEVIKREAEVELAKARPALEEAEKAAAELSRDDVNELKAFKTVSGPVEQVVRCVLIYLGAPKYDWPTAQKIMADIKFLDNLRTYKKESISQVILNKVKPIVTREDFNPEIITTKLSKAAGGIAKWCKAMREYAEALKIVKPKEEKLRQMTEKYAESMVIVQAKQQELALIKQALQQLEDDFQKTKAYIDQLDEDKQTCVRRLTNAGRLMELLGDEGERWKVSVEELYREEGKLNGNVFIAAASISYIGPFTGLYREKLVNLWIKLCQENRIQASDKYSLVNTLGDPIQIRSWGQYGLPSDSVSIDNAILTTKTQRWPLMIDPQTQANSWIKKMHKDTGLKVLKLSNYQNDMIQALTNGWTVLIEDVYSEIDPGLDSVLTKSVYKDEGVDKIQFGDKPIMFDKNFKLYITTKLPNPHFLPEICIKLTIINFTVTFEGLEEQLLVDVVINEAPEVEVQRDELVMAIAKSKNELKRLENLILSDLANSNQDTILDNVNLIQTLDDSKTNSVKIGQSLIQAEIVEETINQTRNSYKDVSIRGSILYFVIADLAGIDPMYQNSLMYVKKLFNAAIRETESCPTLEERIIALENSITKMLYMNICRGLFEAHKVIYSFLICTSIKRKSKSINEICWNYLLRGAGIFNASDQPAKPEDSSHFITDTAWDLIYCLQMNVPESFGGFCKSVIDNLKKWEKYTIYEEELYLENIPCGYGEKLTIFEKLLVLKIFKPEKLMFAFSKYVEKDLGRIYAESPVATMDALFQDSDKKTPIIFVLSSGADPTEQVIAFSRKMNYYDRFFYKSLGQGQDKEANALIEIGKKEGHWVLLQNCHLFKSWMPSLESICEGFGEEEGKIHEDFRLVMTSMPATYFPVSILQNGLKMTTEPPRGIKANLKRSYNNLVTEETYNALIKGPSGGNSNTTATEIAQNDNSEAWKRLLFGLCFFHGVVQERRKFGPLGWNIRYEFNDSDLETSIKMLKNFLMDAAEIPWKAMTYMTGEINYGGRVTDDWDRHLLMSVLEKFYTEDILTEGYAFSPSGIYYVPTHTRVEEMQEYIESLPLTEEPEIFGMHQNANIAYQQQESEKILQTILNVQPRVVAGAGGKSSEDTIYELAEELLTNLPPILDKEDHAKEIFKLNAKGLLTCLSTVLLQEIERYNKLLTKMFSSLSLLLKAIKGEVIMSPELDLMFSSFLKNFVPPNWQEVSYPSLKPLPSWIKDLAQRVEFMRNWLKNGHPAAYWLSGLFFPHGFMTGALQTYARKKLEAIDQLEFCFKVLSQYQPSEVTKMPEDGIYVYGLFIEGARWSSQDHCLEEQLPGQMTFQMPLIHFLPQKKKAEIIIARPGISDALLQKKAEESDYDDFNYKCPCYKTSVRAGILSTTGQSTNFILAIDLPCSENEPPEHWTLRGTALLSMLND